MCKKHTVHSQLYLNAETNSMQHKTTCKQSYCKQYRRLFNHRRNAAVPLISEEKNCGNDACVANKISQLL